MSGTDDAEATTGIGHRFNRAVGRALLDPEDAFALGLCRVLVVTILTLSLLSHVGAVSEYFSSESVLSGEYARRAFPTRWSVFFHVDNPWAVRGLFALGALAHVLWVLGLYTRVASIVAFVLWVSMVGRNPLLYSLPDQLQVALAFVLMVVPSGRGFSLDARWRKKGGPVPVWCRRLIQLQLAVLYAGTGLLKSGKTWTVDGTALYYTLQNPYNRHFDISSLLAQLQPWVLRPLTWMVLVWEVGFAGFVAVHWVREALGQPRRVPDLRKPFLGFGILMHVSIQLLLYVVWFTPLCICAYSCFLTSKEARALVERVRKRVGRSR